jgi:hypothetical protein
MNDMTRVRSQNSGIPHSTCNHVSRRREEPILPCRTIDTARSASRTWLEGYSRSFLATTRDHDCPAPPRQSQHERIINEAGAYLIPLVRVAVPSPNPWQVQYSHLPYSCQTQTQFYKGCGITLEEREGRHYSAEKPGEHLGVHGWPNTRNPPRSLPYSWFFAQWSYRFGSQELRLRPL